MQRQFAATWILAGAAILGARAWAQGPGYPPNANDPPNVSGPVSNGAPPDQQAHGVARLSLMNGPVSVAHGNAGDMAGAAVNAPLVTEDRVLTGANGRAEIQFDGFNLIRIAGSTEIRMGDLQYKRYQVQIAQGLVMFRVLRDNDAQIEISTPTVAVHPLRQGIYRVSVNADGLTEITVRAGEAEVASVTGSEPLRAGQLLMSRGSVSDPEFKTVAAPPPDDWDRWNADRDRVFESAFANPDLSRNVSPDIYGTEDLNAYGRWVWDPSYGNAWVPAVGPDWAPYQDGNWSYLDYYGWTWIGYEPWGWAPYHYGRWFRGAYGWGWYPGPIGAPYFWSPALVGFFGWGLPGFGMSFGFGFGNIGWVPLAPFEAFRPWYGRGSVGGVRSTAIVSNVNVASMYRNARVAGGVTSMHVGDFGRTAVNASSRVRASAGDLSRASMMNGGAPIAATRESRNFGAGPASTQGMPRMNNSARFFSSPSNRTAGAAASGFNSGSAAVSGGGAGNAGGWQRFTPSSGASGYQRYNGGNTQGFAPRSQGGSAGNGAGVQSGGSQAVRIAPPIVNSRGQAGAAGNSAPRGSSGSFGGARPSGGSSAPRSSGGGFRGGSGGGHGGRR